jgi:hypothetical protein
MSLRQQEVRAATKLDVAVCARLRNQYCADDQGPFARLACAAADRTRVYYDYTWVYEWHCDCPQCAAGKNEQTGQCIATRGASNHARKLADFARRPMDVRTLRSIYFPDSHQPVLDGRSAKERVQDKTTRQRRRQLARRLKDDVTT